eukprot:14908903-Ditylum_brightwellii.AAC.1
MDLDEGEVSPSSDTDPTKQRWVLEMARAKPKTKGKDNEVDGFRLFYKQCPFNYSKKEFLAEQGHCEYRACKAAETELKAQRSNNKHMMHSY